MLKLSNYNLIEIYKLLQIDILRIMGIEALKLFKLPYICIRLDTINSCNLKCKMCSVPDEVKRTKRIVLPIKTFITVLKRLSGKIRMLHLSCLYEPFTNPRFCEYLDAVGKYRLPYVSLVTNGILLNEKIAESLINNKITEISFSIDSTKADVYESIRRGAHFEKLLKNLDMLNRKKAEHGSEYPRMRLNFVILPSNYSEITSIVDFAASKAFNYIQYRNALPMTEFARHAMACDHTEIDRLLSLAKQKAINHGIEVFLPEKRKKGSLSTVDLKKKHRIQLKSVKNCIVPWFYIRILPDGSIKACNNHGFTIGNINYEDIEEILESKKLRDIKKNMLLRPAKSCKSSCNVSVDYE